MSGGSRSCCPTEVGRCYGVQHNNSDVLCPFRGLEPESGNLPAGVHDATWNELVAVFGAGRRRERLLHGLLRALYALKLAGCRRAYVDGSFVTSKPEPGDFDVCWEAAGVVARRLDPVLLDFSDGRAAQKAKYGGELFISTSVASPPNTTFIDFFQIDKATGRPKGVVAIDSQQLP